MRIYWLHGWATDSHVFEPLTEKLSSLGGPESVRLDLPGFGAESAVGSESFAGSVIRRIEGDSPLVLAGWSLGAMVALEAAAALSGRGLALVLISGCGRFCSGSGNPHGKDPRLVAALARQVHRDSRKAVAEFLAGMFAGDEAESRRKLFLESYGELYSSLPAENLVRCLEYLASTDLAGRLGRISCPVLLIHGALDPVIDIRLARRLAAGLNDARLVEIEGYGHAPFWRNEESLAGLVRQFVGGMEGKETS